MEKTKLGIFILLSFNYNSVNSQQYDPSSLVPMWQYKSDYRTLSC